MNNLVKISDYVINELYSNGIDTVFGVTGGAVVHFFDSIEKHDGVSAVFFNHEQSAAFAVESYANARKGLGAGIFTTGPGATNALTGLAAAWLDSIPAVYISGQVRANQVIGQRHLRQVGTQEIDIVSMVKSVTKYAVTVTDIREVKYHLTKGIYLSQHGRPGPVWIDIPVDISWSSINESDLIEFNPNNESTTSGNSKIYAQSRFVREIANSLKSAKRPLVLVGSGVRFSDTESKVLDFIERYKLPIVTSWAVCDMLESSHPLNIGRPGVAGQRGANLAVQNCDFLLCLGSHLNSSITGTLYDAFAREAKIAVVDIDIDELDNIPVHVDWKVCLDVERFLVQLSSNIKNKLNPANQWFKLCSKYQDLNNFSQQFKDQKKFINSYFFQDLVSKRSKKEDYFVSDGGGTVVYSTFQSCRIKKGQRLMLSTSLCSMGSGIPESIGVSYADNSKKVICFVGDGSFPFNMQELQLIKDKNLSIIIFVFNNDGYVSIRTTQEDFLEGNFVGSSSKNGLSLPKIKSTADSFGIKYLALHNHTEALIQIDSVLESNEPVICEVMVSPGQEIMPRQGFIENSDGSFSARPLEDMYPFLERNEYESLMVVDDWCQSGGISDGKEVNLLKNYYKSNRTVEDRGMRKMAGDGSIFIEDSHNNNDVIFEQMLLKKVREFGDVYFDGDRLYGYGGYYYDKKYWYKVASDIIDYYGLKNGDKILDVGCAKGYLLHDLKGNMPGLSVFGIDISEYAVSQSHHLVKSDIQVANAKNLPFPDDYFDLVLSINTLSELNDVECRMAIREITRVSKDQSFIVVNSWSDKKEKKMMMKWNVTALSNHSKNDWKIIFKKEKYNGDYYWFTP